LSVNRFVIGQQDSFSGLQVGYNQTWLTKIVCRNGLIKIRYVVFATINLFHIYLGVRWHLCSHRKNTRLCARSIRIYAFQGTNRCLVDSSTPISYFCFAKYDSRVSKPFI